MTSSSLDLIEIFLVIFLLNLNKQDKFEKDKNDAFDDDTENKPDDHSSFDNRRKKSNMTEETYELPESRRVCSNSW